MNQQKSAIRVTPIRRELSSLFFLLILTLVLLSPLVTNAHENWVLTADEVAEWSAKPKPEIFTELSTQNILMYLVTALFLVGWILLNFTGARELFPDLQVRLASYGGYAGLALRIALFVLLGMSAFGLAPRHGAELYEASTLFAPDLELRSLEGSWEWIAWTELALALLFLFGIYVRGAAVALFGLCALGFFLFGMRMLDYFGFMAGAALYLLLQGAGSYYVPMPPVTKAFNGIKTWLENQPRERAQWLLRMAAGFNFLYLGVVYKFFQPTLMMGIIELHQIPTLGLDSATFVLMMALVETLSGALIIAGVLMRPLSVVLFSAMVFFSALLGESVFGHILLYGLLVAFVTNSAGRWRLPIASDKPGRILILGGSFAGVHCAMKLERLLGEYTNVKVTLIHEESYFLFHPLLPEVVGGAVQPGNIVNPIRRCCPRTHFLEGEVASIDHKNQKVQVTMASGDNVAVEYDQLVVALDAEPKFSEVPGLLEHGLPIMTIGDALFLRQRVLGCLEEAETFTEVHRRQALLTFSIVGGGLRGTATAAEIQELVNSALVSYPGIQRTEPRILLFETEDEVIPKFDPAMRKTARSRLANLGVEIFTGTAVTAVTPQEVILSSGKRIPCRTVIGTQVNRPRAVSSLPGIQSDGRLPVNEFLQNPEMGNILVAGDCADARRTIPFMAIREIRLGRLAAYNALAGTQGFRLLRRSTRKSIVYLASLGRKATVSKVLGVLFGGIPAWVLSRLVCLLTLPGLERNLRIVIDWILDIPFRNDIVVLAPQRTLKLSRAHYEIGDEIIRQGERGDCAYVLQSGEVEVLVRMNGQLRQLAKLSPGDCFGEIALLCDIPRTATIRCLTPVDVTVLPRDQFVTLAEGYRDLGNALKSRASERMQAVQWF